MFNKEIIILCFIAHLLGDFYFQSNKMALLKNDLGNIKTHKKNYLALLLHAFLYAIPFSFLFAFTKATTCIIIIASIFVSHLIIDLLRVLIDKKIDKIPPIITFIFDQAFHICVILLLLLIKTEIFSDNYEWLVINFTPFKYAACILFLLKPSSIIVSLMLDSTNIKLDENKQTNPKGKMDVGAIIGYLERLMVLFLGILNAWTAIAIVITAKTWARQNDIRADDSFKHQYLIGTFTSLVLAISMGLLFINI